MHVFYHEDVEHDTVVLSPDESRHCIKVLRMSEGGDAVIVDGHGTWCKAQLLDPNPRKSTFKVKERIRDFDKRPFHLHMAVAPTKSIDRFEWFLEKATECGIDEITPLLCEKSERRVIKPQRLEKILIAAMKQSLRATLPRLNGAITMESFLRQPLPGSRFIAHCAEGGKKHVRDIYETGNDAIFLVGPEGDFADTEIEAAAAQGFTAISMGAHRLRTETAAMALCVQVNSMNALL